MGLEGFAGSPGGKGDAQELASPDHQGFGGFQATRAQSLVGRGKGSMP